MSPDFQTFLIAITFASQIVVCSFLSAWRFAHAYTRMLVKFPPAEFPRLYPLAPEKMQLHHNLRMALRLVVGVAAILILALGLIRGVGAATLLQWMLWVAIAQMAPLFLAIPQKLQLARALRAMPAPAVRSVELRSWRLTDFVTPTEIVLGIVVSTFPLLAAGYFYFNLPSGHAQPPSIAVAICALLLLRMLYVVFVPVAMPRPDPYMSEADVFRNRRVRMQTLFRVGIFLGVYVTFMQLWSGGAFHLDRIYIAVGASLLIQMTSWRWSGQMLATLAERDFTPYRAEAVKEP